MIVAYVLASFGLSKEPLPDAFITLPLAAGTYLWGKRIGKNGGRR